MRAFHEQGETHRPSAAAGERLRAVEYLKPDVIIMDIARRRSLAVGSPYETKGSDPLNLRS